MKGKNFFFPIYVQLTISSILEKMLMFRYFAVVISEPGTTRFSHEPKFFYVGLRSVKKWKKARKEKKKEAFIFIC